MGHLLTLEHSWVLRLRHLPGIALPRIARFTQTTRFWQTRPWKLARPQAQDMAAGQACIGLARLRTCTRPSLRRLTMRLGLSDEV